MPHKRKDLKIKGSNLWYLVGLITSDGCLSPDGRHIDITAKDRNFLTELTGKLKIGNRVTIKNSGTKKRAYHIQIANRNFYDFLLSVGLMPKKSLIINSLNIPSIYFSDFLRGMIDGDGCIRKWIHSSNKKEQWSLRIYSGSAPFMRWLRDTIEISLRAKGRIYKNKDGRDWILKYGKMAARAIVERCYYKGCFGLQRKIALAKDCIESYRGWNISKTVNA